MQRIKQCWEWLWSQCKEIKRTVLRVTLRFWRRFVAWIKVYTHSPLCLQLRRFRKETWAEGIVGGEKISALLFRTTIVVSVEKLRWYLFAWVGSKSELSVRVPFMRKITIEIGVGEAMEITETTMLEKFEAVRLFKFARKKSRKEIRGVESRYVKNDCN